MLPKKNKNNRTIKLVDLFKEVYSLFKAHELPFPEGESSGLLSFVLKKDLVFLLREEGYLVSQNEYQLVKSLIKKRLAGWSLAALTGTKAFYNLNLIVDKNVLIPRPETENLVDLTLDYLKTKKEAAILDIGTGSGAIIVTLFKNVKSKNFLFYASDISKKALLIAKKNAKKYQAKVKFLEGDLLLPFLKVKTKIKPTNLVITANLPYLTPAELKEDSIKKEPKSALVSGLDGLWHYQRLFLQIKKHLLINNQSIFLICEINPAQVKGIEKLAKASFSKVKISFQKDYRAQTRFAIFEI